MHPVVCSKFCSIRLNGICVAAVISIVCPFNSLHCTTEITIVSCKVNSEEFSIRTISWFYSIGYSFCSLKSSIFDTGITSVCSCTEAEGSVFIFCNSFQTVCLCSNICCQTVRLKIYFSESTCQCSIILYNCISIFECFIIRCLYFYRNILQTGYFVICHFICCTILKCKTSTIISSFLTICEYNCVSAFPMRNCVRALASFNHCNCLEASSVKTMVGRCSCYRIKCTKIRLTSSVLCIGRRSITCCIDAFCRPVLSPGKSCIDIFIFCSHIVKCKIIICAGSYNEFGSICYFDICKIQCSVFFDDHLRTFSGSLIGFIAYCYSCNCLDISAQLFFCGTLCRYQFIIFRIINCRYRCIFYTESCLDWCIFTIGIADHQSVGACCQCSCCDLAVCICNFCFVNRIFCCESFRKCTT